MQHGAHGLGRPQGADKPRKLSQRTQSPPHQHVFLAPRSKAGTVVACTTAMVAATLNDSAAVQGVPLWRQQELQRVCTAADLAGHHTRQHWPQQQRQAPATPGVTGLNAPRFTSGQHTSSSSSSRYDSMMLLLRTRSAASNPALLTAAIKACSSWQQASAVFTEHSHAFNHIHTAAFISHLPKVLPSSSRSRLSPCQQSDIQLLLQDISQLAEELLHDCSDRELANVAHGCASLGFYNKRLLQLLLCRCNMSRLKPQELSNLVWAVAKLDHNIHEGWVQEVLDLSLMHMQQGSAAAAAAAVVDSSDPKSQIDNSEQTKADRGLQQQWRQQQQPDHHDPGFNPQEICNIAWALAVMQRRCSLHSSPPLRCRCTLVTETWKAQLCQTVSDLIKRCTAADVAMCLWALAVLGFRGTQKPWINLMLRRSSDLIGTMQGRHIAVVLWATSRLMRGQQQQQQQQRQRQQQGMRLPDGQNSSSSVSTSSSDVYLQQFAGLCFPALQQLVLQDVRTQSLQQQQQQSAMTPRPPQKQKQLKLACIVLPSCAHLGLHPPPAAMAAMLASASQHLQAYAVQQQQQQQQRQRQSPCGPYASSSNMSCASYNGPAAQQAQQQKQKLAVHDVVTLLYGLAKLSFHPGQHFVTVATAAAVAAVQQQALTTRPGDANQCGTTAAAAVREGMQGQDVATLLWSMAKLQCKPPRRFLWLMRAVAADHLHSFSSRDIAVMLWSLGQMHDAPQFKWVRRMLRHFLARLDDGINTAPDICQVLSALPNLPSADAKNLHGILSQQIDDLLPQLAAAAAACFSECGSRELVGVIWGFARLGYCPGSAWQQQHRQRCDDMWRQGTGFSAQEQQILEQSRTALLHLAQQQHCGDVQLQPQQREQVVAQSTSLSLMAVV